MLASALTLAAAFIPQEPSPGIDRELARARAATVQDVEYDLRFALGDRLDAVSGSISMRFQFRETGARAPLILDFDGASISDVTVNNRPVELERRFNHLVIPAELLGDGVNGVTANFTSAVAPTGTPLTVYRDQADGQEYYYCLLYTSDAADEV